MAISEGIYTSTMQTHSARRNAREKEYSTHRFFVPHLRSNFHITTGTSRQRWSKALAMSEVDDDDGDGDGDGDDGGDGDSGGGDGQL